MTDYNTGNAVPSTDPRDLDQNAQVFDLLMMSTEASVPDRLGEQRKTWHQMELDAEGLVSPNVAALAAAVAAANKGIYFSAASPAAISTYDLTAFVRGLGVNATSSAFRAAIGAIALTDTGAFAGSAAKLGVARTIAASGDVVWSVSFDGSANVTADAALSATGIAAGTYGAVTVDVKGRATGGSIATPIANGGTGQTTQSAALSALLGSSVVPIANGGTGNGVVAFTSLPLNNSWVVAGSRRAVYRKILDLVQLEVHIVNGTATDGTVVATLPAGFRPPSILTIPVAAAPNTALSTTVSVPRVLINPDGTIVCQNVTATNGISFSAMIPTT